MRIRNVFRRQSLHGIAGPTIAIAVALVAFMMAACSLPFGEDVNQSKSEDGNRALVNPDLPPNPAVGRMTGVNWFGFETGNKAPHGLWARDYKSMLKQIKDLGFNTVRIPWSNEIMTGVPNSIQINAYGVDPYTHTMGMNTELAGLDSLGVMDKIMDEAARIGLMVILDNHSRKADAYLNETLWYTAEVSEAQWIADWRTIVTRYKDNPAFVAADLNNEPHGNNGMGMKPPAGWGSDHLGYPHTDWKKAAELCGAALLSIKPDLLIIVEGVEEYAGKTYWWGGNLAGVRNFPITAIPESNLVYSPHEYGPEVYNQAWFSDPAFPANMYAIWDEFFWFIYKERGQHLFFGEFGIKEESAADPHSIPYKWLDTLMKYVGNKSSWTFWAMNPNSGDTGGILKDDWVSVNTAKYNLIKPYLAGFTNPSPQPSVAPSPSPVPSPSANPSPSPSASPQPSIAPSPGPSTQPGSLTVEYRSGAPQTDSNTIGIRLKLVNNGASAISLSGLRLRYYYTKDGPQAQNATIDHAGGNLAPGSYQTITSSVSAGFASINPVRTGADTYVEFAFSASAGNLAPQGNVEIQARVTRSDWSNYAQSNDYSFSAVNDGPWDRITGWIGGILVAGIEP